MLYVQTWEGGNRKSAVARGKQSSYLSGTDPVLIVTAAQPETSALDSLQSCACVHTCSVGVFFRRVAGECSGTHQPIIAHNCIHLWATMNISEICDTRGGALAASRLPADS